MAYVTDAGRGLADTITKGTFGESFSELKAKAESERAKAESERAKAIVKLFSLSKLTIEAIATAMDLEIKYVRKVLKLNNLI